MKPLIRWTIGPVSADGFKCLKLSVNQIKKLYDADLTICYNNLNEDQFKFIETLEVPLFNQFSSNLSIKPQGVAWKLYPPRLKINAHELFLDNDLVIVEKIPQIDQFFRSNSALMLEDISGEYGQFGGHVPKGINVNSGLFGLPPNLDFESSIKFLVKEWEENAEGAYKESFTFDEQGIVATILSQHPKYDIISTRTITNCENNFTKGMGMHFVGLNRTKYHRPWKEYLFSKIKYL